MNNSKTLMIILGLIFFLGPNPAMGLRPYINVFLVDFFIIALAVYVFLIRGMLKRGKLFILRAFLFYLILLFMVVSSLLSVDKNASLIALLQYSLVFVLLLSLSQIKLSDSAVSYLFLCYALGIAFAVALSLVSVKVHIPLISDSNFLAGRFGGVWGNPNLMAKQVAIFIVASSSYILYLGCGRLAKFFLVSLILVCSILILWSASFGGIATLVFGLFVLTILYVYKNPRILLFATPAIVLMSLFVIYFLNDVDSLILLSPEVFQARVISASSVDEMGSGTDKIQQLKDAFETFKNNPFVGVGLENGKLYNTYANNKYGVEVPFHSFYMSFMAEVGIIPLILFLIVLVSPLLVVQESKYRLFTTVLLAVFLFDLFINNNIYTRYLWFPVCLLFISRLEVSKNDRQ